MSSRRHSPEPFLPALRFRALTPYFDRFVRATTREREFKGRLLEQLALRGDERVLDLGAGTGTLALAIAERWPGARVVGLDADPDILAIARRKAADAGRAGDVEFVEAFSTEMPFEDGSFDVVVSTLFFHHLTGEVKRRTLREVARVLKPGGRLHVADWGRAADPLQAALSLQARVFDGFEVTRDNLAGRLPRMFEEAGLTGVRQLDRMRTAVATLAFYAAQRPAA